MTHKITIEVNDDELEMLASLFNTTIICELNGDSFLFRNVHPPINKFCHWDKLCRYLREKFTLNRNLNKYPTEISRALTVRAHKR